VPSTPPRVLLATPYDLAVPGGVNNQALGLLDELGRRGVEALLVGPSSEAMGDPRVVSLGPVSRLPFNGAISRVSLDPGILRDLRRLVAEFRPDVVHVQEPVAPLPCAALLWLAPADCLRVGTFHTYSERGRGYLWAWPWVRGVWSRLDVRVAVSEAAREFATRYHQADFQVIPNAIRLPDDVGPAVPTDGALRALFVGRLDEPRKGFGDLVEALELAEEEAPGRLQVSAVGRGGEAWSSRCEELPMRFLGELDDGALATAYAETDLVVTPSTGGESFGIVPLEAMAHGRPVLATRIPGYAAWLDGATHLVPPGDPGALAAALLQLADSPEDQAALAARGREVAEAHSWSRIVERWLAIYSGSRAT
jgi:phosphatidylinositol alpha-mannosyltransferase